MEKFEFYGAPDIEREMTEVQDPETYRKFVAQIQARPGGEKEYQKQVLATRSKLKPGEKMVFGKARKVKATKVEEIERELSVLESTSSPFPEVRERRIEELRSELKDARTEAA